MSVIYFKGFSSRGTGRNRQRTYYDADLIRRDLLNHFNCRVGERVMRPDWGCRIWNIFMEPLTQQNRDAIVAEATRICEADSRCDVVSVQVFQLDQGIRVQIDLNYTPLKVTDSFSVDFDNRFDAIWSNSN